ncbi:hypothetical protein [Tenacibaculum agarivorans]|uniref:hypothetical protein n=1 Tax=Tenacibaculum agarivorans TaxID=1908389 RepID=UPI00094BC4C3|nr:hypothetical protein [Tenacibaculum agarivorans]
MKLLPLILTTVFVFISCTDETTVTQDTKELDKLFNEITELANSKSCENLEEWSFTAYGDKPCGGPWGYIAYPKSIETEFLKKIETYNALNKELNEKTGAVSDCSLPAQPVKVNCVDGKPVLSYVTD